MHNLMNFDKCILLSNHHPNPDRKQFIIPESCAPLQSIFVPSHAATRPPKTSIDLISVTLGHLCCLRTSYKWGVITGCMLLCLAYLTQRRSFEIHPYCCYVLCISSLPFLLQKSIPLSIGHNQFIQLPFDRHWVASSCGLL